MRKVKSYVQDLETMIGQPQKLIDNAKKLRTELESVQEMRCCVVEVPSNGDEIKFEASKELQNSILEYGSVSSDGCAR